MTEPRPDTYDVVICNPYLHPDIVVYAEPEAGTLTALRTLPTFRREIRVGAGAYTGLTLSHLGRRCCYIDRIGDDLFGELTHAELAAAGADLAHVRRFTGGHMFCLSVVEDGEGGTMVSNYPPEWQLDFPTLATMLDEAPPASILYIYEWFWSFAHPRLRGERTRDLVRAAKERGYRVILDVNYKPADPPPPSDHAELIAALPDVDVLLPNLRDAEMLAGPSSPERTIEKLLTIGPGMVCLKAGAAGAYVSHEGDVVHVPARPVDVLDTTGAGDVFGGAFVHGLLEGWDTARSAAFANAAAALAIASAKTAKYRTAAEIAAFAWSVQAGAATS
jgi:5-dehydro-2-deoxygluconokinase